MLRRSLGSSSCNSTSALLFAAAPSHFFSSAAVVQTSFCCLRHNVRDNLPRKAEAEALSGDDTSSSVAITSAATVDEKQHEVVTRRIKRTALLAGKINRSSSMIGSAFANCAAGAQTLKNLGNLTPEQLRTMRPAATPTESASSRHDPSGESAAAAVDGNKNKNGERRWKVFLRVAAGGVVAIATGGTHFFF